MSQYAAKHASARASLTAKGQRITFTRTTRAPDAITGMPGAPVTVTVSGYALGMETGDPATYVALGLTLSEAPSLMVVCDTFGDVPPTLSFCVFGDDAYTVRAVTPFAPDGVAIFATCVVAR